MSPWLHNAYSRKCRDRCSERIVVLLGDCPAPAARQPPWVLRSHLLGFQDVTSKPSPSQISFRSSGHLITFAGVTNDGCQLDRLPITPWPGNPVPLDTPTLTQPIRPATAVRHRKSRAVNKLIALETPLKFTQNGRGNQGGSGCGVASIRPETGLLGGVLKVHRFPKFILRLFSIPSRPRSARPEFPPVTL